MQRCEEHALTVGLPEDETETGSTASVQGDHKRRTGTVRGEITLRERGITPTSEPVAGASPRGTKGCTNRHQM